MRFLDTRRSWAPLLALTVLLSVPAMMAQANPVLPWDHYRVYDVLGAVPPSSQPPVLLTDQFTTWQHDVLGLWWFANPTVKIHGSERWPIIDPVLHYTWWEISRSPGNLDVVATNQFGRELLHVRDARFLLNPALKDPPVVQPPPIANHYKCYDCEGPPVNVRVGLEDQFYPRDVLVGYPVFLCNPVHKETIGGAPYPIVDPDQHYVCYEIDLPLTPVAYPALITDQFVENWRVDLGNDHLLCVPSFKEIPTPTKQSTWGRIKTLYR